VQSERIQTRVYIYKYNIIYYIISSVKKKQDEKNTSLGIIVNLRLIKSYLVFNTLSTAGMIYEPIMIRMSDIKSI